MKIKFKTKKTIKDILSLVLIGALLVGSIAGLNAIINNDTKKLSPSLFSVGSINAQGNYEKSNLSVYTKEMFACDGLTIEPDFEANGTYRVFYYDNNKNFMGATPLMESEDGIYKTEAEYRFARYARIVITPDTPADDNGDEVEDFKIRSYNVSTYVRDYTITVNKDQSFNISKKLASNRIKHTVLGAGTWNPTTNEFFETESPFYFYDKIDVTDASLMVMKVKTPMLSTKYTYDNMIFDLPFLYDGENGAVLSDLEYNIIS